MITVQNYIGGEFRPALSGETLPDLAPATGQQIATVPDSDARDVDAAVSAAKRAFHETWSKTSAAERSAVLMKIADLLERDAEELAQLESLDTGKPVALARRMDINRAVHNFRFFAGAILHDSSECHPMGGTALNYTVRRPHGVAGLISPWNLPIYLLSWKIAPALAAGNTAVAKPSELTPLTADRLAHLAHEAGLPPGVLNIVHGLGAKVGQAITEHRDIPLISFTGGTVTGAAVMRAAGPMFKRVSLELGGKNAGLVFADADLEAAVAGSVRSSFENQGEICLCTSRLYVERSIYPQFVEKFVAQVRALKVGDPREAATNVGALVSEAHLKKVRGYIALAQQEGGTIACGGNVPQLSGELSGGFFLEPTVVTGLSSGARCMQEEIFGPVVSIVPFDREDEVIEAANGTQYGLAATLWTRDLSRAHRVANELQAGTIWVNTWLLRDLRVPFGGMKSSGLGREGGTDSLHFYTEAKNVCIRL